MRFLCIAGAFERPVAGVPIATCCWALCYCKFRKQGGAWADADAFYKGPERKGRRLLVAPNKYVQGSSRLYSVKPGPHAAMLHTCDGGFQATCDISKSHAMCCDRKFNMFNILLLFLEYLSYLLSDFQTDFSILMGV